MPGGKIVGKEYVCGSLKGSSGDSCLVNLNTGKWSDFATDERGGDLLSLYAAIHGLKQGEAAKRLGGDTHLMIPPASLPQKPPVKLASPPATTQDPLMNHPKFGAPSASWRYTDGAGQTLFFIARYDAPEGKQILPWSWASDQGRWLSKAWPEPRPLYNLKGLADRPQDGALLVEGEKAATAAHELLGGSYVVTTWPNGSQAYKKADFSPLYGRRILLWPDADKPGKEAMTAIAGLLAPHCPEIKILDTSGQPDGWDAADALAEKWTLSKLVEWAKPRAQIVNLTAIQQTTINVGTPPEPETQKASKSQTMLWKSLGLAETDRGAIIVSLDNAVRILEAWQSVQNVAYFDEFYGRVFSALGKEWDERSDTLDLTRRIQRDLGLSRFNDDLIAKALHLYAVNHKRNAAKDWFDSLTWDNQERLHLFFKECFGSKTNEDYLAAISHNFWVSMVARVYKPGCQVDNMVILEGYQGLGKTNALRLIGGPWYSESHESISSKDFYVVLQGRLLVEIGELDSFSKAETTRIKQVVTCNVDRYRAPYAHAAMDHPRQCVFVGTTNQHDYLRDPTGGRRFWPISCHKIDLDSIAQNREQLFAEAVIKFKNGDTWHLTPTSSTGEEQSNRWEDDAWEGLISGFLIGKQHTTVKEMADCLDVPTRDLDHPKQKRIRTILKHLGWHTDVVRISGEPMRVWVANNSIHTADNEGQAQELLETQHRS